MKIQQLALDECIRTSTIPPLIPSTTPVSGINPPSVASTSKEIDIQDVEYSDSERSDFENPHDPDYRMRQSDESNNSDLDQEHDDDLYAFVNELSDEEDSTQVYSSDLKRGLGFDSESEEENETNSTTKIKEEYEKFLLTKFKAESVWSWFETNMDKFPSIYAIAKQFLIIPASSALAERLFSKAGNVITQKRN